MFLCAFKINIESVQLGGVPNNHNLQRDGIYQVTAGYLAS